MVGSMNGTIYMPVGEVCSSISDTYREKKNMVTLINTSDVLEGRVLNHERVPNSNLYNYSSNFPYFTGFPACSLVK